jgi:hypothetical protein
VPANQSIGGDLFGAGAVRYPPQYWILDNRTGAKGGEIGNGVGWKGWKGKMEIFCGVVQYTRRVFPW